MFVLMFRKRDFFCYVYFDTVHSVLVVPALNGVATAIFVLVEIYFGPVGLYCAACRVARRVFVQNKRFVNQGGVMHAFKFVGIQCW